MSERQPDARTTHFDEDGLWIPPRFREFGHIVIRTPRLTINHTGSAPLEPYYGVIDETHFGAADSFDSPLNPNLAPDRVSLKPHGEDAVELRVEDAR